MESEEKLEEVEGDGMEEEEAKGNTNKRKGGGGGDDGRQAYFHNYYQTKTKEKRRKAREERKMEEEEKTRPEKEKAKKAIKQQSRPKSCRGALVYEACIAARTSRTEQKKLKNKAYRKSPAVVDLDNTISVGGIQAPQHMVEYYIEVNANFSMPGREEKWARKTRVGLSSIPGAEWGLFAADRFEPGETVGVYMGGEPIPAHECDGEPFTKYPYLLRGVADAEGGVGSGKDILLGMHFMNDPEFEGGVKTKLKANVEWYSDGRVVALRRIQIGEELLVSYNQDLVVKKK